MQKYLLGLVFSFLPFFLISQTIVSTPDFPGTLTWPFLWDIEQDDAGNLYTCTDQGLLHIKRDGVWEEIDLDASSSSEARGITIDDNEIIWVTTGDGLYAINGDQVTAYNSTNSSLPEGSFRQIKASGNDLWMAIRINGINSGLVRKTGDNFTHLTADNSFLGTNTIDDIAVMDDGTVVIGASEYVYFVNGSVQTYNFENLFGFQTEVEDIFIDHNGDIWFATFRGVIKYNKVSNSFEDLRDQYISQRYTKILYTPDNKLWLCQIFEGIHYYEDPDTGYFFSGDITGVPSQAFDFEYFQDTVRVVGNIGSTVSKLTVESTTSIKELKDINLKVYPNPTNRFLHIETSTFGSINIQVLNAVGQVVKTINANDTQVQIDLGDLTSGTYHIRVSIPESKQFITKTIQLVK